MMNQTRRSSNSSPLARTAAWGIHLFTAIGAGLALWAGALIVSGRPGEALWVLFASLMIDALDGTLARRVDVKQRTPHIDGAMMDNIIDFLTFSFLPLLFAWHVLGVPLWVAALCTVASVFGFSNTRAKTEDHFFLGFPSYWNLVVLYLYVLDLPPEGSIPVLLAFAALVFAPVKFLYPSRTPQLLKTTLALSMIFLVQVLAMLYYLQQTPMWLIWSTLPYLIYYLGASLYFTYMVSPEP